MCLNESCQNKDLSKYELNIIHENVSKGSFFFCIFVKEQLCILQKQILKHTSFISMI